MRIVQVAPDCMPLPPENYGGIEKVVHDLTEELVRRGHEVFLYALPGTKSSAAVIPYPESWNHNRNADFVKETLPAGVDVVHDHTHISGIGRLNLKVPTVCSTHCARNTWVNHLIFVSETMLQHYGREEDTYVCNGINPAEYQFSDKKGDYLFFLGNLSKGKGVHHAVEVAEQTQQKLIIAGSIHDYALFDTEIAPRMKKNPNIRYVGEVGGQIKQDLLKNARCTLFPVTWDEAFGLVMVESMACGTPVLGLNNGAVAEVLGGFPELVCQSVDEMVEKVRNESLPDPIQLRHYVVDYFSASVMADCYLDKYHRAISGKWGKHA